MQEKLTDGDKRILKKLDSFLPERIFDAHVHLFPAERISDSLGSLGNMDAQTFMEQAHLLYADRQVQAMFLPYPVKELNDPQVRNQVNAWMAVQLDTVTGCVAQAYVLPDDSVEDVEALLIHPGIRGFKCYYTASRGNAGNQSDVSEYLPESAWEVADARGLCITLHLVKELSPADPENQEYVKTMCHRYPNAKLILAHCGRGFAPWTILEAAENWKDIPNLYYDLAAICEPAAMFEVIRQAGVDHVMWGTDYPLSHRHWRPYACGAGFEWVEKSPQLPCALLGIESLFALYQTSRMLSLSAKDVEDIFYNNAMRILF